MTMRTVVLIILVWCALGVLAVRWFSGLRRPSRRDW